MSAVRSEAAAARPSPLALLLARWPVTCSVQFEQAIPDAGYEVSFPSLLVVTQGPTWCVESATHASRLETGDLLVAHEAGRISLSTTQPEAVPSSSEQFWMSDDPLKGPSVLVVRLDFIGARVSPWLMPKLVMVQGDRSSAAVDSALQAALIEAVRSRLEEPVANLAAQAVYLNAIARHLQSQPQEVQLLAGLFDPEIGPVVASLLEAPARDWTVESLAEIGGMSRSAFARKFRELMGAAPIDFLIEVRMWQAARLLRQQSMDLKSIARDAGYLSPAAFSVAFKRWSGEAPSDYRRRT